MQFGPGSVFFSGLTIPPAAPGTLIGADDGLSVTANKARFGQPVGAAGDPAALLEDRETPDAGHRWFFGKNNGVDNVIGFSTSLGIFIANNTGQGYSAFWQIGANSTTLQIFTGDGKEITIAFEGGTENLIYNSSPANLRRLEYSGPFVSQGLGAGHRAIVSAVTPADNLLPKDFMLFVDTTGVGTNLVFNVNPALIPEQFFHIKKTSADVNTITITPTTGTIQGFGAPAATFAFNLQGQSVNIYSDGTNLFII